MVNIIVAVGNATEKGFPIGKNGAMPWNNKADLKWFKDTTTGHPVIMGRKTYEAIGHPLKNRTNIIVSTRDDLWTENSGVRVYDNLEDALKFAKTIDEEVFIIGGASLYEYALNKDLVDRVYIDLLAEEVNGADTFFPDIITLNDWEEVGRPVEIEPRKAYAMQYVKVRGKDNHVDDKYLNLVNDIIKNGVEKDTRAGKTRSVFGVQLRFNLKEGLPMLTTKKMFSKGVIHELLWFLKGDTNIKYLVDNGVHIWDDDAYRYYLELMKKYKIVDPTGIEIKIDNPLSKEEFLEKVKDPLNFHHGFRINDEKHTYYKYGDLGPVYGKQWRNFGGVDQVKDVIEKLRNNPDDRRIMISAWNVGEIKDMALPPCHYTCQFYTKKMTFKEREQYVADNYADGSVVWYPNDKERSSKIFDNAGVPTRKLSCMFHMRSNDICCGAPFNWMSYGVLTHMVAQCTNMDVDELIFECGDTHIYENHIKIFEEEQAIRNPHMYPLPKLWLNPEITNIDDFTYDDIKVIGYKSYPTVKYPLNVGLFRRAMCEKIKYE